MLMRRIKNRKTITRLGSYFIGTGPELDKAFMAFVQAIKSGVRKDIEYRGHLLGEVLKSPKQQKVREALHLNGMVTIPERRVALFARKLGQVPDDMSCRRG